MADILEFKSNEETIQELCVRILNDMYSACMTCEDEGAESVSDVMDNSFTIESMEGIYELVRIDPEFAELQQKTWEMLIEYIVQKAEGSADNTTLN